MVKKIKYINSVFHRRQKFALPTGRSAEKQGVIPPAKEQTTD